MSNNVLSPQEIMTLSPIIPVIEIEDVSQSIDLANALIAGGINVLEITLRTPAAMDAISLLAKEVPSAVVGAGTVLNPDDLAKVRDAGASFAISPGCTDSLLQSAKDINFPLIPGVSTGSEIMNGLDLGYTHFKLFPATSVGGIPLLKSFSGPFQQAKFCPTGGINENNYLDFLALENVLCAGGSWVAPTKLVKSGDFNKITEITASALAKFKN
ncbi:bifunctional 4-hydroxy-2-oxoglutarate aldolase/2-dehydro-3-deoxy-phosphogluconate aldolase [Cocleimonas sp. KMM 6892]|jgi:2-dehydro-3-deoxyphosphogluconate aldolase/(4S)-4-hydroxy-2-oxoglutarate aldolase|uniref:bifunctional 4-hydroxy-2-oxoglutarate aldolase/2-dehydro-3-deoxy-phosphogluconate aldolase n=1 Tax=unclassified Cocleimonas TaxID=2639732 RepID=UPI002DBB112B|nr:MULTISPECIES: bifunctional 4-hydroxy-2-oxoglutarate aldolase/2-dehydro-3-deoxy-phosphogluconate aldolase [unclassified Cocleimonas]MEB8432726.1 bifunctional 4-hydroxy-2-oxoglutarate aldolase/2-dehydro-3-deoxy-phosphogluconate aldolase [Cocleimonas sp. KMM 6892]MEC4715585.1 bifunctional 4-hydroxy-2-oxoglutarate aldolase/2-dehydro-3-deoxy-phosphogluconate aldolase [Cocleimonas sp. KMM 6895]MEC4744797.1 bifunctional 4-hydroxy-2-oxoglutarate aldolase/2-dehydro-3-deoxy-phosphogluconate aldolase [C